MKQASNNLNIEKQWLSEEEACELMNISQKWLRNLCYEKKLHYRVSSKNRRNIYKIDSGSIPEFYKKHNFELQNYVDGNENIYSESPAWAKVQVEKYMTILSESNGLKGTALFQFVANWNVLNSDQPTSYSAIMKMRQRYFEQGISGLLAQYGKRKGNSNVQDEYFDYFKGLYLKQGGPSALSCWDITFGYAKRKHKAVKENFPCCRSFLNRLHKEIPPNAICLARKGKNAWNRKHGNYIERDYSTIVCGTVWVADHAQIDVACVFDDGTIGFPWVTAWRDFKAAKWLGWVLEQGTPNSDRIFQSFYYAALDYGLPTDVLLDNGKDFRCKDFAGGRTRIKVDTQKPVAISMLAELNITVHFALPYNAQTKPIERDFNTIKEMFSKHCVGYRGGNVVERPEKLAEEIKQGKVIPFAKFKEVFNDFIINVLNKRPCEGKNHLGKSRDEVFYSEFKEKITPSRDALKLFCMRTSKTFTIGRNGIKDSEFGITYWADWMIAHMRKKVYLRRDIQNFKEAWAFSTENDEFMGTITAVKAVAALYAEEVSKAEFKEAMSIKKRAKKLTEAYLKNIHNGEAISIEEKCENYKAAYLSEQMEQEKQIVISKIANTNMDKAILKNKKMQNTGKGDLSAFANDESTKNEPLYIFDTDRVIEEEYKGVAYGEMRERNKNKVFNSRVNEPQDRRAYVY